MKKFSLDIVLKRSTLVWKKSTLRNIFIFANIQAGKAAKVPPLGSLLGTYGVNAEQFCEKFNTITASIFIMDVLIPVAITITPAKTFTFIPKLPTIHTLLNLVLKSKAFIQTLAERSRYKKTLITTLYLIAIAKIASLKKNILKNEMHNIYGSIRSYDLYNLGKKSIKKQYYSKKKK